MDFKIEPVGFVVESRENAIDDYWGDQESTIEMVPPFTSECIEGLDQFSHIEVLFLFHLVTDDKIVVDARHPRNNTGWPKVGIFSQRGKNRPNRLGSTMCKLKSVEGNKLFVAELDAIRGTPIIDIKPVIKEFLPRSDVVQPKWCQELMKDYWQKSS